MEIEYPGPETPSKASDDENKESSDDESIQSIPDDTPLSKKVVER
jgi:hypothetical protein